VARQTRSQRRARRDAQQQTGNSSANTASRARARQAAVRPSQQPQKSQTGQRRVPGSGGKRFVGESWGELKKVEWPGQKQVIQATAVVLIACVVVGTYLFVNDVVWKHVVSKWLLGQ
jgi:preprotein translocase SecE subunit